jgi:hypothetical protein
MTLEPLMSLYANIGQPIPVGDRAHRLVPG